MLELAKLNGGKKLAEEMKEIFIGLGYNWRRET